MSMIDGLRNVLGINQDPEADSYVDDNEEDDIFPGGGPVSYTHLTLPTT